MPTFRWGDGYDADTVLILPLCGLKSAQHISLHYGSPVLVARGYFCFSSSTLRSATIAASYIRICALQPRSTRPLKTTYYFTFFKEDISQDRSATTSLIARATPLTDSDMEVEVVREIEIFPTTIGSRRDSRRAHRQRCSIDLTKKLPPEPRTQVSQLLPACSSLPL